MLKLGRGGITEKGSSRVETVKPQRCVGSVLWMDESNLVPKGSLGVLHNCWWVDREKSLPPARQ